MKNSSNVFLSNNQTTILSSLGTVTWPGSTWSSHDGNNYRWEVDLPTGWNSARVGFTVTVAESGGTTGAYAYLFGTGQYWPYENTFEGQTVAYTGETFFTNTSFVIDHYHTCAGSNGSAWTSVSLFVQRLS